MYVSIAGIETGYGRPHGLCLLQMNLFIIRAYNKILENHPSDMTFGLHLCRGNFKGGMHFSEGGYDRIATKLFNEINVDCYYVRISFANPMDLLRSFRQ